MFDLALPRRFRLPWLTVCGLLLAACAAPHPKVSYDYDPAVDFAALKQFAWAEPAAPHRPEYPLADNSLVDDRIKSVIESQLLLKGIRRVGDGSPDFLLNYRIVTQKHGIAGPIMYPYGQFYSYGMGFFGYSRGSGYYNAWSMPGAYWEEYETHAMVVDFLHPVTHKQLWRGILQDALDLISDPAAQKYQLDTNVQYLFRNFPPRLAP